MNETVSLNGVAHIYLTVQDYPLCLPFYEELLPFFDMQRLVRTDVLFYCVGSRTGIGIRAAGEAHRATAFDQYRAGLHHLCLRARSRQDIERIERFVTGLIQRRGGKLLHGATEDAWAPGYYSILFEDPCGTRLEVNYVPGKGNLDAAVSLPLPEAVQQKLSDP